MVDTLELLRINNQLEELNRRAQHHALFPHQLTPQQQAAVEAFTCAFARAYAQPGAADYTATIPQAIALQRALGERVTFTPPSSANTMLMAAG